MAVDSEAKRWSMLAMASGPVRSHVFNPATAGLSSTEKITVLQHYGGIAFDAPAAATGSDVYRRLTSVIRGLGHNRRG